MELGATELYFALASAQGSAKDVACGFRDEPDTYLAATRQYASNYITKIYDTGSEDTLNLYDVSGLAHFELYRALGMAGNPDGLGVNQSIMLSALQKQLAWRLMSPETNVWGFGVPWEYGDTTSHGAGLSVMARAELYYLTSSNSYNSYAQNGWGMCSAPIPGDHRSSWATVPLFRIASSIRWRTWWGRWTALRGARRSYGELRPKVRPVERLRALCLE